MLTDELEGAFRTELELALRLGKAACSFDSFSLFLCHVRVLESSRCFTGIRRNPRLYFDSSFHGHSGRASMHIVQFQFTEIGNPCQRLSHSAHSITFSMYFTSYWPVHTLYKTFSLLTKSSDSSPPTASALTRTSNTPQLRFSNQSSDRD